MPLMRPIFALLLTTAPFWAEDAANLDPHAPAQPGAVALYLQAMSLYGLGQQAKDPLIVLTAARLLRGLSLTDTARTPDPASPAIPLTAPNPRTMLNRASGLDAGQNYPDLIDSVATEIPTQPKALRATAASLAAGASQTWALSFFGGTYAELAILGTGTGNLDLLVSDDQGHAICVDKGSADTALCGFTLRDNGDVTVTVTNAGTDFDSYMLLTN